jgi:hypothetical protein
VGVEGGLGVTPPVEELCEKPPPQPINKVTKVNRRRRDAQRKTVTASTWKKRSVSRLENARLSGDVRQPRFCRQNRELRVPNGQTQMFPIPPSIWSSLATVNVDSSDARNTTALAISLGFPKRPAGTIPWIEAATFFRSAAENPSFP